MPGRVRQGPSPLEELPSKIANIFEQVQGPAHNHKKNFVALYKLHEDATQITQPCRTPQGEEAVKPIGEKAFMDTFFVKLGKILSLKKGTYPADQVVKFISGYVKHLNDKAAESRADDEEEEDVLDIDSATSRFTERLVEFLLKGFGAKDKSARYRVVQICAEIVISLGELDEDLYMKMRRGLLERLNDKEISVRVQAAIALCKFARTDDSSEESNEDAESEPSLLDCLMESMTYDDAVDVRRTIVRNIPLTRATLSTILERTRDTDAVIRKLVYSHVLDKNVGNTIENGATHPSTFTIAQRELIVRNGIQDRDPGVRVAASNLMVHWMDILGCTLSEDKDEEGVETQNQTRKEEHLLKFLAKFDLSQEEVATIALQSIFEIKTEIFQEMQFPPQYWATLSPEKAFLARVFVDHCIKEKTEALKESALPEITALAFRIQDTYNQLVGIEEEEDVFGTLDDEARARRDDERDACELTLEEMLKLAVNLDYSDEIGRRKMYALMRDMLSREKLSERHVGKCLNVLQKLWPDERDLIRLIVEIVQNLRDPGDEEEPTGNDADPDASFTSVDETPKPAKTKPRADMTPEEQRRADHIDLMCLILLEGLLERVDGALGDNSTLYGVYNELIVPCTQHADPTLREKATKCFGLLALISKPNFSRLQQFMDLIKNPGPPEDMKLQYLRILFDNLMLHQWAILKSEEDKNRLIKFFTDCLENFESTDMRFTICAGLAKLAHGGIMLNNTVIRTLILAFFSPSSVDNHRLLQFVEMFFKEFRQVKEYQAMILDVFIETFGYLTNIKASDDDEDRMVSILQIGQRFVDWTNPFYVENGKGDPAIHVQMAIEIVRELSRPEHVQEKDDRRVLFQLFQYLYLPETVDDDKIKELKVMMDTLKARRPPRDSTSKRVFAKFEASVTKMYEAQLHDFNDEDWKNMQEHKKILDFVDSIIPEDEDEGDEQPKKGRKRRSPSIASTTTDGDGPSRRRRQTKKRRVSTSDDDESEWDNQTERSTPPRRESEAPAPTRRMPRRAATRKPAVEIQDSWVDFEDADAEATPRSHARPRGRVSEESDITQPTTISAASRDSIMDDDSEEEDEVSGLLVED